MGTLVQNNSGETAELLGRARVGDKAALTELFTRHRDRLRRMVEMRLDWRLQARLDASDVIHSRRSRRLKRKVRPNMAESQLTAFLDTCIFLHFKPFTQIKWK